MLSLINQEERKTNIVQLTETRLSRNFDLAGLRKIQTQFCSKGGCWSAFPASSQVINIKYKDSSICW